MFLQCKMWNSSKIIVILFALEKLKTKHWRKMVLKKMIDMKSNCHLQRQIVTWSCQIYVGKKYVMLSVWNFQ